ncbi:MAG: TIGR03086 family protein [Ilumatobacteraceae bacterium]
MSDQHTDRRVAGETEADRFRRAAGRFSEIIAAVPDSAWSNPACCTGWTTIDPIRHLNAWVPALFGKGGLDLTGRASAGDDPLVVWEELRAAIQAALDDPDVAGREIDLGPAGRHRVDRGIDQFVTGDVVVHAWDVATAAALDWPIERIVDEQVAAEMAPALTAIADMLVASGHYAPAVPVADNANAQERLIAATGRDPHWKPAS